MPSEKPFPEPPESRWHTILKKKLILRGSSKFWACLETLNTDYGNQFWYSYEYNDKTKQWKRSFLGHVNSFDEKGPM